MARSGIPDGNLPCEARRAFFRVPGPLVPGGPLNAPREARSDLEGLFRVQGAGSRK